MASRELIRCHLGLGPRELLQQGRLANRRESDQRNATVSVLLDLEAFALLALLVGQAIAV